MFYLFYMDRNPLPGVLPGPGARGEGGKTKEKSRYLGRSTSDGQGRGEVKF